MTPLLAAFHLACLVAGAIYFRWGWRRLADERLVAREQAKLAVQFAGVVCAVNAGLLVFVGLRQILA